MLLTLVDPHKGFESAYNRWYERDHFYAGCMEGPWQIAGSRWVATREMKDLRWGTTDGRRPDRRRLVRRDLLGRGGSPQGLGRLGAAAGAAALRATAAASPSARTCTPRRSTTSERLTATPTRCRSSWRSTTTTTGSSASGSTAATASTLRRCTSGSRQRCARATCSQARTSRSRRRGRRDRSSATPATARRCRSARRAVRRTGSARLFFVGGDVRASIDWFRAYTEALAELDLADTALVAPFLRTIVGTDTYVDQIW